MRTLPVALDVEAKRGKTADETPRAPRLLRENAAMREAFGARQRGAASSTPAAACC
jgi:hypothetical protein